MPKVNVTGVTISHVWDDDSCTEFCVEKGDSENGPYVSLSSGGDSVWLRPESWLEIQGQIDAMFYEIKEKEGNQ